MYTKVKTDKEIKALRESCRMAAEILDLIESQATAGITGIDINELVKKELKRMNAKAAFFGYQGFPGAICVSRNDEVVHGIPNSEVYEKGDLLSVDFGVLHKGMISDTARTLIIDDDGSDKEKSKLVNATREALMAAIKTLKDGVQVGDIGRAAQEVMERNGLGIVRDLVGHGVGHHVHEEPNIPNYGQPGTGDRLKAGMTIAIEPMATLGSHRVAVDPDGWTIRTMDRSLSAHFEHTILITKTGYEILTKTD